LVDIVVHVPHPTSETSTRPE